MFPQIRFSIARGLIRRAEECDPSYNYTELLLQSFATT